MELGLFQDDRENSQWFDIEQLWQKYVLVEPNSTGNVKKSRVVGKLPQCILDFDKVP